MKIIRSLQTVFLSLFVVFLLEAQAPINILSIQQGLPKSQIYDIAQDSFGFIWLGTRDGLVKFDGHDMQLFRKGSGQLPFNYCYDLFIDESHRLWMASNADYRGIAYLDLQTQKVRHINTDSIKGLANNGVVAIKQMKTGNMVVATKDFHLSILDDANKQAVTYDLNNYLPDGQIPIVDVTDLFCDPVNPNTFWVCTREGLAHFNVKNKKLIFTSGRQWRPVRFFHDVQSLPYLWVALEGQGGLLRINLEQPEEHLFYGLNGSRKLATILNSSRDNLLSLDHIARKSPMKFYVATKDRGIGIFDLTTGGFDFLQHHSPSLVADQIRSIYANSEGEVWIGSDKNGLFYLRPEIEQFTIRLFPEFSHDNTGFRMSSILDLEDNSYLITLDHIPFFWIWHREDDIFEQRFLDHEFHYGVRSVKTNQGVLIGSNRGFYRLGLDLNTLTYDPFSINSGLKNINRLVQDAQNIWFVNWGSGIGHYDGEFTQVEGNDSSGLRHTWTHDLVNGADNRIWVGQENGFYSIEKSSMNVEAHAHREQLNGFGNPNFKALTFDHYDRIWTGNFGAGIYCYDISEHKIISSFSVANGLPSDRVYDLFTDREGVIWVWTSEGLSSFMPHEDVSQTVLRYYPDSKYISVGRNGVWFYQVASGEIFFGLDGGFAYFDPQKIRTQKTRTIQPPLISGMHVFDRPIPIVLGRSGKSIFRLKPSENFISISFSAPSSGFISQQEFNYRMDGIDDDWVSSGNARKATYTELDPGTYYFRTRVRTEQGTWSEASTPLTILLAAPWYATPMMSLLWLLVGISILYFIHRIYVVRELMRTQLAFRQVEAKNLRELDNAKSQFFTQISHEFRTPLTVILGVADQLRDTVRNSDLLEKSIDAIERNGRLLLNQINQILDLSKLQSQRIGLQMVNADIVSYIKYLLDSFTAFAESQKIETKLICVDPKIPMDFDPDRIKDVFVNLISNALKFSSGDGCIEVRLSRIGDTQKEHLRLEVEDDGEGMAPEEIKRIFEPYFRGAKQSAAGFGLGLSTTQQWVQAMGGQITVVSRLNRGSTFTVEIPITQVADRQSVNEELIYTEPSHAEEFIISAKIDGQPTILVIEDNVDVANYLQLCLHKFYVVRAEDGEEGIKKAIEMVPDLIISDIMMPLKDGHEVCAILRDHISTSHVPIILLTAKATQAEMKQGLSLGADAYLTKPFDREELLIRVEGLLSQRKLLQAKFAERSDTLTRPLSNNKEDEFLDAVEQYVVDHLSQDISVVEMAKDLGMSRVQLYRKIKALTGKSVSIYIRLIRLYKARKILRTEDLTIAEVSYQVGFSDPSYFTKVFKETFGKRPSDISDDLI